MVLKGIGCDRAAARCELQAATAGFRDGRQHRLGSSHRAAQVVLDLGRRLSTEVSRGLSSEASPQTIEQFPPLIAAPSGQPRFCGMCR
jgi:hypothetical protein